MSSVMKAKEAANFRREAMRIAGEKVHRDRVIEITNPYSGELVGTVPKATLVDVRRAFSVAKSYKATLSRHERAQILRKAADISRARVDEISDLITAEAGLVP